MEGAVGVMRWVGNKRVAVKRRVAYTATMNKAMVIRVGQKLFFLLAL